MWSNTGFPQTCGCNDDQKQDQKDQKEQQEGQDNPNVGEPSQDPNDKRCNMCKCLSIKSKSTPKSWEHNHFCYKPGSNDPNFKILRNGKRSDTYLKDWIPLSHYPRCETF